MSQFDGISRRDLLRSAIGCSCAGIGAGLMWNGHEAAAAGSVRPDGRPRFRGAIQSGEQRGFDGQIVTPSGTPLGGNVHVDIFQDGSYYVKFHMHSSSVFGSFDFNIRAYLTAYGAPTVMFLHNGHVSGVDDADWEERGFNPLIAVYWRQFQSGAAFQVTKDYSWGGIVGGVIGLVNDIIEIGAGAVGAALGCIIGATAEALDWLGATLGPGGTLGVVGGVVVFAVGALSGVGLGASLILGTVSGVAIGAVVDSMVEYRPMNDAEILIGRQVFGDTIPYQDVMLSNLNGLGDRPFTAPGVDGKTYINLGPGYADPIGYLTGSYSMPGQLLIHELTHAWQIAQSNFLPGFMCSALINQGNNSFGDSVYAYDGPGPNWWDFNFEQQGAIVDQWFGGTRKSAQFKPMDQESPYYRYIWSDILGLNPSPYAPANLRTSSSGVVSRFPGHLDIFFPTPDTSIGTVWWDSNSGWGGAYNAVGPGATLPQQVSCISRLTSQLDLFWAAPDGTVQSVWWGEETNAWNWVPTIAPAGSAGNTRVVAVSQFPWKFDVFWISPDGSVIGAWWDANANNGAWASPYGIAGSGSAAGAITALARKPDHLDIFWVMPDGSVAGTWWDLNLNGAGWWSTFTLTGPGAAMSTDLAVVSRFAEHIDVFYVGTDGAVMGFWWDAFANNASWNAPYPIAGAGAGSGPIAVVSPTPDSIAVFWIAPDGSIGNNYWLAVTGAWNGPVSISPPGIADPNSPLAVVNQNPVHYDLFWTTPDGAIGTQWWDAFNGQTWSQWFAVTSAGVAAV